MVLLGSLADLFGGLTHPFFSDVSDFLFSLKTAPNAMAWRCVRRVANEGLRAARSLSSKRQRANDDSSNVMRARGNYERRVSEMRKEHAQTVIQLRAERERMKNEQAKERERQRAAMKAKEAPSQSARSQAMEESEEEATRRAKRQAAILRGRRGKTEAKRRQMQVLQRAQQDRLRAQSANWIRQNEIDRRIDEALENPRSLF